MWHSGNSNKGKTTISIETVSKPNLTDVENSCKNTSAVIVWGYQKSIGFGLAFMRKPLFSIWFGFFA